MVSLVKVETKEEDQHPKLNSINSVIKVFIAFVRTGIKCFDSLTFMYELDRSMA